jgi:hypothetical protein
METHKSSLAWLVEAAPSQVDLADPVQQNLLQELADRLIAEGAAGQQLLESATEEFPLGARVVCKLAQSKALMSGLPSDFRVSVVFAVYKEGRRLKTRQEDPLGEDFLRQKAAQLDWLFGTDAGLPNENHKGPHRWKLVVVDDGCPEQSGQKVKLIAQNSGLQECVEVLHLADAIQAGHPVSKPLTTADDSRKGGSVLLGMNEAASDDPHPNHVVIFTDADLSTHLGQCARLSAPILLDGKDVCIANRRDGHSVVVKEGHRNQRGRLFIYLWKRLLPLLGEITDTQCGFKAFRASALPDLVSDTLEKKFAFDLELLVRAELRSPGCIARVPLAWIDSEALSTTTDVQPYLSMLQAVVSFYRHYLPSNAAADRFADFISGLSEEQWQKLIEVMPQAILEHSPAEMASFDGVSADELSAALTASN